MAMMAYKCRGCGSNVPMGMFHQCNLSNEFPRCERCGQETDGAHVCLEGQKMAAAAIEALSTSAPNALRKAAELLEERGKEYDKPGGERSMAKTVELFNLFHGTSLTEAQGWHFMQILKDVRLFGKPGFHRDSAEDGVAYSALKVEAKAKEAQ